MEAVDTKEQEVKAPTEIKSGDKFAVGSQYGYPIVVFGKWPESEDPSLRRAPAGAFLIKLADAGSRTSSRRQGMFGKDTAGNYFIENLSTSIPMGVNDQVLEPEKKLALGTEVDVLGNLSIQWGDVEGITTHRLDIDSYGETAEKEWQATFEYSTRSLL
jgi:hypothetical protein